ncbi:hypothetical protein HWV00_21370 (plasmid) [Moritella sp. 24]|uniref:hypothetical protein n=1 Tax=Moritella sp. 24 TaxID=2746230 RepID=UPI001BA4F9A4|nr:hypothetical protein [Moritella sp. 24]QUM78826.1 hypothetical protein HWV00_21370 [Moritella sp. 24]
MASTKLHTKIKRNAFTEHWPASGVASTGAGEIAEVVNILCWCLRSMFVTKAVNGVGAGRPMFYRTAKERSSKFT